MRSTSELTKIATKTPIKVSKMRAKTYRKVSPVGIERVIINKAETPPMIPALLFIATLVIMVNMVAMGTKIRVTQKALWKRILIIKNSRA